MRIESAARKSEFQYLHKRKKEKKCNAKTEEYYKTHSKNAIEWKITKVKVMWYKATMESWKKRKENKKKNVSEKNRGK